MKFAILAALALLLFFGCTQGGPTGSMMGKPPGTGVVAAPPEGNTPDVGVDSKYFAIPLAEVTAQAKKYSMKVDLVDVNFFAVKGTDGQVHVAFDGCDVCGGKFGYRQEGNDMVCNKCGQHFKINDIGSKNIVRGGCNPSYLNFKIEGNNVLVENRGITAGRFRFV
jgi:uncharacterized membrane protein